MLCLVPLINIPFDWLSIGFTRAMLRRGCERDAPSPLWFGLADFAIGIVLMLLLAAALILALQTADRISAVPGRPLLVDVPYRLGRIAQAPRATENWWIDFTLFSTLILSAFNAAIGMCSLMAWFHTPAFRSDLIKRINNLTPDDKSVRDAVMLQLQGPVFLGILLGCLCDWGTFRLVLYGASFMLTDFLGLAGAFDWLLIHGMSG